MPQSIWYFNAATGSDANDGLSAASPLRTIMGGYYKQLGLNPLINWQEDWYIEGDLDPNDTLLLAGTLGPNGIRNVHGVPTIKRQSTLTGVTPYNQTSGQWDEIQDGTFDFAPYVGNSLVVIDTGAANGPSYCWIAAALGPGRARVSFLGQRDPTNAFWENIGPASVGNNYQLWTLPVVPNYLEDVAGYTNNANINQVTCEFLHLPVFTARTSLLVQHNECLYDGFMPLSSCAETINPCLNVGYNMIPEASFATVLGLMINATPSLTSGVWIMYGMIWQNCQINTVDIVGNGALATLEVHHVSYGLGIFDSTNPIIFDEGASLIFEAVLWGQNNTGTTLSISRGARVYVDALTNLRAITPVSGNDIKIDGYTSLPAVDPTSFVVTSPRLLSFSSFATSVAGGGFGGAVFNPRFPSTGMISS